MSPIKSTYQVNLKWVNKDVRCPRVGKRLSARQEAFSPREAALLVLNEAPWGAATVEPWKVDSIWQQVV